MEQGRGFTGNTAVRKRGSQKINPLHPPTGLDQGGDRRVGLFGEVVVNALCKHIESRAHLAGCESSFVEIDDGSVDVPLEGCWFDSGFQGTMGELLCAIEEDREPSHSARNNLRSLELCFAALQSAETGQPVEPGSVRSLPIHNE